MEHNILCKLLNNIIDIIDWSRSFFQNLIIDSNSVYGVLYYIFLRLNLCYKVVRMIVMNTTLYINIAIVTNVIYDLQRNMQHVPLMQTSTR